MTTRTERIDEANERLEWLRWGREPRCTHCGSTAVTFLTPRDRRGRRSNRGQWSRRRVWKCYACRRQFSATTGTVMQSSHIAVWVWLDIAARLQSGEPLTSQRVEALYDMSPKTAVRVLDLVLDDMSRPRSLLGAAALATARRTA